MKKKSEKQAMGVVMLLLIMQLVLAGCAPKNIVIQDNGKIYVSPSKTNLVVGLKEIEDVRPEDEKEHDQFYDKSVLLTINERLFRHLKTSGIFQDVLYQKFDNGNVDMVLDPKLNHFYYDKKANGWTALMFLFAFTGFPGLIYIVAGGPSGEHYAIADLELEMTTHEGKILAVGHGEKKMTKLSNIHNGRSEGIGVSDGKVLSDAMYDTINSLSMCMDSSELPTPKFSTSSACGSDRDCKGDRICVAGKCNEPKRNDKGDN